MKKAQDIFSHLKEPSRRGSVSKALAYIGLGDTEAAIANLQKACDEANPLMAWLHLWPLFDSLRNHPDFEALITRMNLPA